MATMPERKEPRARARTENQRDSNVNITASVYTPCAIRGTISRKFLLKKSFVVALISC